MSQTRYIADKSTENVLRVEVRNSSGAGRTGLTHSTSNLSICIEGVGGTPVLYSYSQGDGNIESITTLGAYQAPSTDKVRFKEVSESRFPGLYELHLADEIFDPGDKTHSFTLSIFGATNMMGDLIHIQFSPIDTNARQVAGVEMGEPLAEPSVPVSGTIQENWTPLEWLSFLGRFIANKMTLNKANAEMIVYRDNGSTSMIEQEVSDDGDVQTRESAS
jgi:hypothetical protein